MKILMTNKNRLTKIMEKITKLNPVKRKNLINQRKKFKEKKVLHLLMNFHLILNKRKKIIRVKK